MVIVDSSVWITFQRDPGSGAGRELDTLLSNDEVTMVGPVLAEILQGARSEDELEFFAQRLTALSFVEADQETWIRAGELSFRLRQQGLVLGFADLVIASLAMHHDLPVYTLDDDFRGIPGLELYSPRNV